MSILTHLVVLVAGAAGGAFAWPHIATLYASWKSSRVYSAAQAVIAKAEADAKALEAARKVVAAAPKATGTTGPAV